MSFALIGTSVIQFLWIKHSVDLQKENFTNNVREAMSKVHDEIIAYHDATQKIMKTSHYKKPQGGGLESFLTKSKQSELEEVGFMLQPNKYLENIRLDKLDQWVKDEFDSHGIKTDYDYGIYSNKTNSFSIYNGKYVVSDEENPQSSSSEISQSEGLQNLYGSIYFINLFPNETEPGQLKVYFPNKTSYLWKSSWVPLVSSLIFTGLILFCFVYTINVILFQKKVSEMKTDFINNMTHEFKTPISTISLAADSMISPKISGNVDKVKRYADIIKQENKRMLGQVEKVLQMAQLEKSDFQLKVTDFDVHDLIKTAAEHARLKVNRRDGSITLDLKATSVRIKADNNHISNVIHNLLDNAEKYSKEIPEISIITSDAPNGINIEIADKGIGMSKDALKSIFEKFYRVHTGNLHDVKGFGLGLSYVKAIVNAHQGSIKVESELDIGSSFTIFLPFSSSNSD